MKPIQHVLVANRGEIACRILKTCAEMGIGTTAVCSEADAHALHVSLAERSVAIGAAPAAKSYLDIDAVLAAARDSGADAVHPGYGFLAEHADFARAVEAAGLAWIGPAPAVIEAMGDKERARALAAAAGIPVLPGSERFAEGDAVDVDAVAAKVGFPLLVKAAAGGGGIGMQRVDRHEDLAARVAKTQSLAGRAFADSAVYLERFVARARHVEVQVFGDGAGGGLAVFDRDCTIQRRFQKVIEEAPAPGIPGEVREALRASALALVREQHYAGAGTVEFIYDCDRDAFYFLEMNTRIQVEHTVSEMITGIDLVRWQIEQAAGQWTPPAGGIQANGHALQCRLYAERPAKNFLPSPGTLESLRFPAASARVRIDTGVREGDVITPYYDPMIAKLVVLGSDRDDAIARMREALAAVEIGGVSSNLEFLDEVLVDPLFTTASMTTRYVDDHWQANRQARQAASG